MIKANVQTQRSSSPIDVDEPSCPPLPQNPEESKAVFLRKRSEPKESRAESRNTSSPLAHQANGQRRKQPFHPISSRFILEAISQPREKKEENRVLEEQQEEAQADSSKGGIFGGQQLLDSLSGKLDGFLEAFFQRPVRDMRDQSLESKFTAKLSGSKDGNPPAVLQYNSETSLIETKLQMRKHPSGGLVAEHDRGNQFPAIDEDVTDFDYYESVDWIKGFASKTDKGCTRNYNEDRISIITNVERPDHIAEGLWPKCSFFAIYDGHGGHSCPEFLKDNLHQYIFKSQYFPHSPKMALLKGFEQAEQAFRAIALQNLEEVDVSGSCAVVVLVVNDLCYIANLGDSRVISSFYSGNRTKQLTTDMKPSEESEQVRVSKAGGKIYQSMFQQVNPATKTSITTYGPLRILPGRLNVCRSFGDVESKEPSLGGKPGVIIAVPEIRVLKITPDLDFLILASDGIFDRLENQEVVSTCWKGIEKAVTSEEKSVDRLCEKSVDDLINQCLQRRVQDNVSAIMISFKSQQFIQSTVTKQGLQKSFHERLSNMLKKSRLLPKSAPQEALLRSQRLTPFELKLMQSQNIPSRLY
jgi:serine/threonine protein phosphatase PrpC